MALYKLSKPKTFHLDYCGCTTATFLLNDQIIRDAIQYIRQLKSKRDFVKTTITTSKDGIQIIYNNEEKYSTTVPTAMIAGSAIGKSSLHNTVGVVYISPLTGQHYPAFIHVYRCDSSHTAQKFLSRLRCYLSIENHRLHIIQLEQRLLEQNLLNIEYFNAKKLAKKVEPLPSTTNSNNIRQEQQKLDPIKSITEELQKKIDSHQPILFPPKDYDTLHVNHGNIQRAQAWKSTEPAIVGYSSNNQDNNRIRRVIQIDEPKMTNMNERTTLSPRQGDPTIDPVETVSLAFDFLKDETSSIFTENDGNIESVISQQSNKQPIYRFRPPQINAITKKLFSRSNNYDLSNSSSRNDFDTHYNQPNHYHFNQQHRLQNGQRTRSETGLYHEQEPSMHLSPNYASRLVNGSRVPVSTNPLWTPTLAGSQPNLLSPSLLDSTPLNNCLSPQMERRISSNLSQHTLYGSNPDDKSDLKFKQKENQHKRSAPAQNQSNKKQISQSQYLDTNEFILRSSNGQPLRNDQHLNRNPTRDFRPQSVNINGNSLDVYY